MTNLTRLYLYINQLTGAIPTELGSLTNLTELHLSFNRLTGAIPTELGSLTNLTELHLARNQLSGSIPTELGNLTNLTQLSLARNQLSGSIPTELGNLTQLYLSGNQLSGAIPTDLGSLTNLTLLRLNNNQLSGAIPTELGSLTNLVVLGLSRNQLTGAIPTELGSLTNLRRLYLYGNQLTGAIPTELLDVEQLEVLGFDYNENGTDAAIALTAGGLTSPITWTLSRNDSGSFAVTDGSVAFNSPPDYENPVDSTPTDNVYRVNVTATGDSAGQTADVALIVVVRNVDEPPGRPDAPRVAAASTNGHNTLSVSWDEPDPPAGTTSPRHHRLRCPVPGGVVGRLEGLCLHRQRHVDGDHRSGLRRLLRGAGAGPQR